MSKDEYGGLASVVQSAVKRHADKVLGGQGAVLGTMTASGVKLDDFKHEIQDYLIAELQGTLVLQEAMFSAASEGLKDSSGGVVSGKGSFHLDPAKWKKTSLQLKEGLNAGDRVLAMRVNGGNDVVILCKVVNGRG